MSDKAADAGLELPTASVSLANGLDWHDDWFAVGALDAGTLAIGEPAYHQKNWCYLISDGDESLLFDTGSGRRPIAPLLARLRPGALRAMPSHMHYDHLGGIAALGPAWLADLPMLRARATGNRLTPDEEIYLGGCEGLCAPSFEVGRWLAPGEVLRIGRRRLRLLHTPGHSPDSVSLWEAERNRLFAADLIYPGPLFAQTPGASLCDYRASLEALLPRLPAQVEILCAHGETRAGIDDIPRLGHDDLRALLETVSALLAGPAHDGEARINDRMTLLYAATSFPA